MPELEGERQRKSKVLVTMNNKGGCGKTTIAMALGMYLVRIGNNVLFWDNDPQCNLTQRLGLPDDRKKTERLHAIFQYPEADPSFSLIAKYPYLQRIPKTTEGVGKVGIMPGSHYSETWADSLNEMFDRHGRMYQEDVKYKDIFHFFNAHIDYYKKYYDYIVIDTAPALEGNILNQLAIKTSDEIIYPIDGLEAALGIRSVLNWMDLQTASLEKHPNGIFTMVKYQVDTKNIGIAVEETSKYLRNSVYRALKEIYGDFVCDKGVKELRSLRHSVKGVPVPGFGGKTQYTEACAEIMECIDSPERENIFEYTQKNGAILKLEEKLAVIAKRTKKREPKFKIPRYKPRPEYKLLETTEVTADEPTT